MKKILIADDDAKLRRILSDFLKNENFLIIEAENGAKAIEKFYESKIDLAILDVMMPEYDGWSVCREIRKKSDIPIIMLTARTDERDEAFGFDLGADEYIKKPFSTLILVKRIKAILKRTNSDNNKLIIDSFIVDLDSRILCINEKSINLTTREFDLLEYFII